MVYAVYAVYSVYVVYSVSDGCIVDCCCKRRLLTKPN